MCQATPPESGIRNKDQEIDIIWHLKQPENTTPLLNFYIPTETRETKQIPPTVVTFLSSQSAHINNPAADYTYKVG